MAGIAFVYPGQGVQTVGMGKDFYENSPISREIFDMADKSLDFDIKKICFEENEEINNTEYTQAALVTTYLAITKEIEARGIKPRVSAGLSLGEYAAIAVAGGMSYADAIKTVRCRGIFMNRAVPKGEGTMAAILGPDAETIDSALKDIEDGEKLIEIETVETNEDLNTVEKLKEKLNELKLPLDTKDYFIKKAEMKLKQISEDGV